MSIEEQNKMLKERLMTVEHEKFQLAQQVAQMSAEMAKYRKGSLAPSSVATSCAPSPPLHADLFQQSNIKQEIDDYPFSLPTPQQSAALHASLTPPSTSSAYSRSPSPAHGSFNAVKSSPELTQHPAEMLCGLQCQSGAASTPPTSPNAGRSSPTRLSPTLYALSTQIYLMTLISAVYSHLLHPLRQIFLSLRTGSPLPMEQNTKISPAMTSLLIRWLISMPATNLKATTTTSTATTSTTPSPRTPTFRLRLLQRLLLCSPALARPLKDAAGGASRLRTSYALNRTSEVVEKDVLGNRNGEVVSLSKEAPKGSREKPVWLGDDEVEMSCKMKGNVPFEKHKAME